MTLRGFICAIIAFAAAAGLSLPAQAHPHVWISMKSEVVYAPDGRVTGIRHHWSFDDMFSAYATQGIEAKEKGRFTAEELAPLAKINVDSLKEFGYFTYATADGQKVPLGEPLPDYSLDYKDAILTLNFTLPLKTPLKAKAFKAEVYDPQIFIDFSFAKDTPVTLAGAPDGCKLGVELPRELTFDEGRRLSQIGPNETNTEMAWGANFANKILVNCQ